MSVVQIRLQTNLILNFMYTLRISFKSIKKRKGERRKLGNFPLQGPGRDEPRAAVGNDDESGYAAPRSNGIR